MKNEKLRVLLTTNIPAPYMIDYVSELGKKTDLTVLFEVKKAKDRDDAWYGSESTSFRAVFLNGIPCGNEAGFSLKVLKYLSAKKYDRIIIANPTTPTGIAALLYCRWFGVPFCIQSEGGFQGDGRGFKQKFKKYIMEKADCYLTGMGGDNDYFLPYAASKDRLRPYHFTSQSQKDIEEARAAAFQDKNEAKSELGMGEAHIILSVGRFSYMEGYGKGYDILMRIAEHAEADVGFYIVGDEPTQEFLTWQREKRLNHVHFVPFKAKRELAKYYTAADVFVILSRRDTWGLVVNEAMSYGLPVVSSDQCIGGVELIENGVNGFVVPLDDEERIEKTLIGLARDKETCRRFGQAGLEKIKDYTIENMAETIYRHLVSM